MCCFNNSLQHEKNLLLSELQAIADNNSNEAEMMESAFDTRGENMVSKRENTGCQHFLLFPQPFKKPRGLRVIRVDIVW